MGEYFPGEMKIGGKLSLTAPDGTSQEDWSDAIGRFINYVTQENKDYEENKYPSKDVSIQDLAKEINKNGHLTVANSEASWGSFEDLEDVCVELGLSFDRHSSAKYEYDAELVRWRPGMNEPEVVASNESGKILIPLDKIERVRGILMRQGITDTIISDAQDALDEILPKRLMDVPKFELAGEVA